MQGTCELHLRRAPARCRASGLTLLEMLVVFVLASMISTLLVQGAGFFLGQYDTVKRIGREASFDALQQRWFASTVQAMLPHRAPGRRFVGAADFFQGITIQPVRAPSGIPVAARWSIESRSEGTAVIYSEQQSPCPSDLQVQGTPGTRTSPYGGWSLAERDTHTGPVAPLAAIACTAGSRPSEDAVWTVLESDEPLTFAYAGLDRAWWDRWPIDDPRESIPREVRLITSTGQTVWTASFGLYPEPIGHPGDPR